MTTDERLEQLEKLVREGFQEISKRLDAADQRFEAFVLEVRQRFDAADKRFDAADKRFDAADQRFDGIDQRMERQGAYLADFRSAIIQGFEKSDEQWKILTDAVHSLDGRIPGLTKAIGELQSRIKIELPKYPAA